MAWFLRSGAKHLQPTDVAIWPGLLLNFFALVELLTAHGGAGDQRPTHPPALERWRRIAAQTGVSTRPEAYAARFDFWFHMIRDDITERLRRPSTP